MNKFLISIIFILAVSFFACKNAYDVVSPTSSGSQADWSGETVKVNYSSSNYVFAVSNTTRNLDVNLPSGKKYDVYAVEVNNSDSTVRANDNQYIVDAGFLNTGRNAYDNTDGFVLAENLADENDIENIEDDGRVRRVHFVDNFVPISPSPFYENPSIENYHSLPSVSASYFSPPLLSYSASDVGTEKEIYVDIKNPSNPGDISKFAKKKATLQAVGEKCYVWVVNGYLGTGFNQIDADMAKKLQKEFDGFYEYVRYVFGEESDNLITGSGTIPMPDTKVNIVVYDILEDATSTQTGGVLGYFYSKDYYTYSDISNGGKYFYVDSYFTKKWPQEIYSTLAHEFQHMISFNVKNLKQHAHGYSGYNEMLSMLCEDMLQDKMGLSNADSPKGRFGNFVSSYYRYGIFDEPVDAHYYSVAYMFGAFLARNYGGAKLVQRMAQNSQVNAASITAALQALGYNETFESVFREYAKALVLDNQTQTDKKTFNKNAKTYDDFKCGNDNYKFPMTGFNIFDFKLGEKNYNMHKYINNIRYSANRKDLHGKGIVPYYVGYSKQGGDLRLTFSSPVNSNSKVYVLVQECNHPEHN